MRNVARIAATPAMITGLSLLVVSQFSCAKRHDMPTSIPLSNAVEASAWLRDNRNPHGFAGNRFGSTGEAKAFVQSLYDAGAALVAIPNDRIYAEEWRLQKEGGPYSESLLVQLPEDPAKSRAVWAICEREYIEELGSEYGEPSPPEYTPTGVVVLGWD